MIDFLSTSDLEVTKNTYEQSRVFAKVIGDKIEKQVRAKMKKVQKEEYDNRHIKLEEI